MDKMTGDEERIYKKLLNKSWLVVSAPKSSPDSLNFANDSDYPFGSHCLGIQDHILTETIFEAALFLRALRTGRTELMEKLEREKHKSQAKPRNVPPKNQPFERDLYAAAYTLHRRAARAKLCFTQSCIVFWEAVHEWFDPDDDEVGLAHLWTVVDNDHFAPGDLGGDLVPSHDATTFQRKAESLVDGLCKAVVGPYSQTLVMNMIVQFLSYSRVQKKAEGWLYAVRSELLQDVPQWDISMPQVELLLTDGGLTLEDRLHINRFRAWKLSLLCLTRLDSTLRGWRPADDFKSYLHWEIGFYKQMRRPVRDNSNSRGLPV